jgi:hypothetical protein
VLAGPLSQDFAQGVDVLCEVVFFDHRIGPDRLHQFVFSDYSAGTFDKQEKRIKHLRLERDYLGVAQQAAARGVYAEGSELEDVAYISAHTGI